MVHLHPGTASACEVFAGVAFYRPDNGCRFQLKRSAGEIDLKVAAY